MPMPGNTNTPLMSSDVNVDAMKSLVKQEVLLRFVRTVERCLFFFFVLILDLKIPTIIHILCDKYLLVYMLIDNAFA